MKSGRSYWSSEQLGLEWIRRNSGGEGTSADCYPVRSVSRAFPNTIRQRLVPAKSLQLVLRNLYLHH